jgi:DNA-binding helix-hairpin-helix protein with protein kinase domain
MTRHHENDAPRQVVDGNDRIYTLTERIGEGGQGVVFRVKEGGVAVKIINSTGANSAAKLRKRLRAVRCLDLKGLPVVLPERLLQGPSVGYTMKLVDGFAPLMSLMRPPANCDSVPAWHLESGGLRGRLERLALLADALCRLHSRGVAYGDPSPANVLVTGQGKVPKIFLIDSDNLCVDGLAGAPTVFTNGYGAPELVTGRSGCNSLTDAHAFAIMVAQALMLRHPFVGDMVEDGEVELEEAAFRGDLPWIGHSTDERNRTSGGIPLEWVATPRIRLLFTQCFERGLSDASSRPGMTSWRAALGEALDGLVDCAHCGGGFHSGETTNCPWCGSEKPAIRIANGLLWSPEAPVTGNTGQFVMNRNGEPDKLWRLAIAGKRSRKLLRQHAFSDPDAEQTFEPVVKLQLASSAKLRIKNIAENPVWLRTHGSTKAMNERLDPERETTVPLRVRDPWYCHFGAPDAIHRAVQF